MYTQTRLKLIIESSVYEAVNESPLYEFSELLPAHIIFFYYACKADVHANVQKTQEWSF